LIGCLLDVCVQMSMKQLAILPPDRDPRTRQRTRVPLNFDGEQWRPRFG